MMVQQTTLSRNRSKGRERGTRSSIPRLLLCIVSVLILKSFLFWNDPVVPTNNNTKEGKTTTAGVKSVQRPRNSIKKRTKQEAPTPVFNKVVWMYWAQGMEHLESLANTDSKYATDLKCVQAWKLLNPAWDVRVLNKTEALKLAPKFAVFASGKRAEQERFSLVKQSNILRLELLSRYSGVWSDTSNCPFQPLDDFLPKIVDGEGFYAPYLNQEAADLTGADLHQFKDCHEYKHKGYNAGSSRSIANFFIASARPHHLFVDAWLDKLFAHMKRILNRKSCGGGNACLYPYFLAQCAFTQVRMTNETVAQAWETYKATRDPQSLWAGQNRHSSGVCTCGPLNPDNGRPAHFYKRRCYFVKKQSMELADYVLSERYLKNLSPPS